MVSKNNFDERLRRMEQQSKKERFSIRKLTVGTASVLLGATFLGANNQNVQAAKNGLDNGNKEELNNMGGGTTLSIY